MPDEPKLCPLEVGMPLSKSSDRERHLRAVTYALVSLALALVGYLVMGFDRAQTLGYAVAAYVLLNALNFRTMFGRREPEDGPPPRNSTPS